MREHFLGLVERTLAGIDPDPKALLAALRRSADAIRAGHNPLDEGGIATLIAGPAQYEAILQIGGMMSLLEGHGDVTMNRAAAREIPGAETFNRTLHQRRRQRGLARILSVLVGLEAKMRQYEQGERFIEAVEAAGGRELMSVVWEAPEWLPSWEEIKSPPLWISRAGAAGRMAGQPA